MLGGFAAAAVAVLALSCTGDLRAPPPHYKGAGHAEPQRGGAFRFSVVDDVRNLDPAIGFDEFSVYAMDFLYDTLLTYDGATSPDPTRLVPDLADRWSVSADGLSYSFHLRDGIVFADGSPITAGDFVYTLDRLLSPELPSPGAQFYQGIAGAPSRSEGKADHIAGVHAKGDRDLEIILEHPDASFPLLLAMKFSAPVKEAWVRDVGPRLRDRPLATGPFVLAEWRQGDQMIFRRNPRYWNPERPYLDEIVLQLLVSREVAVLKFLHGEIDTVDRLSSDDYLRFARAPEWQPYIFRTEDMAVYGELLEVERPPFNDKRVRQAMNFAINKDDTVQLYNGRAMPAHGVLPPRMPGYNPELKPYPYDPERAKSLLAEGGYPNGFNITYTTTKDEIAEKLAQSMQSDLAKVGIKMDIQLLTFPAYLTAVGRREFNFAYSAWSMDFPDPWDFMEVKFHSRMITPENSNNDSGFRNAELDQLLDAARMEQDREKRLAMYRHAEAILYEECPWIWHYYPIGVEVRQPYVMNYYPHPVWRRTFRDTWLDDPRGEAR